MNEKQKNTKRVFVSIKNIGLNNNFNKLSRPKLKFLVTNPHRKSLNSRSKTPDLVEDNHNPFRKPKKIARRPISPFILPKKQDRLSSIYFKPRKEAKSLIPTPISEKEIICMPYEVLDATKAINPKILSKPSNKKPDLKKGSFSNKQITTSFRSNSMRESDNSKLFISSIANALHDSISIISRTPSPVLPPRDNKFDSLSKNFKINKQAFSSETKLQDRSKSVENGDCDIEPPWQAIVRDLEELMKGENNEYKAGVPRIPIKSVKV